MVSTRGVVGTDGKPVVIPVFVYTGDLATGKRLLRPVRNRAKSLVDLSGPLPWTALQRMFDPFAPEQVQRYYWKDVYINRNDHEVLDRPIEIAATTPSCYTDLVWQPLGAAMGAALAVRRLPSVRARSARYGSSIPCGSIPRRTRSPSAGCASGERTSSAIRNGGLNIDFPGGSARRASDKKAPRPQRAKASVHVEKTASRTTAKL